MIPTNAAYIYEALAQYNDDEVQVHPDAPVSRAEDLSGAFVQAWVWISAEDAREAQKVMP